MQVSPRVYAVLERLDETRGLYYNLDRHTAELLFVLARLTRPATVVEVGTANGYSAIVLGAAVQPCHGRVITIERDGRLIEEARANIVSAGLQDVVTVYPGSAYKVLKRLPGPLDFVFLDATKQEYVGYLERIRPALSPHALLLADNVLSHQDELLSFLQEVMSDRRFSTTIVPLGLGLLVAAYASEDRPAVPRDIPAMNELVVSAARRVFLGTAAEVQNRAIFFHGSPREDRTLDGYDRSLAEEANRLPRQDE